MFFGNIAFDTVLVETFGCLGVVFKSEVMLIGNVGCDAVCVETTGSLGVVVRRDVFLFGNVDFDAVLVGAFKVVLLVIVELARLTTNVVD